MTPSYLLGYRAGQRNQPPFVCPFGGATDGSMRLQMRWREGYFDGLTGRVIRKPRRYNRKTVRTRWPRSEYARQRLMEALKT